MTEHLHPCRCEMCRPDDPDPRLTEAYRHESEVRFVSAMESSQQQEFFEGVQRHRGEQARLRLEAGVVLAMPFDHRKAYLERVEAARKTPAREKLEAEVRKQHADGKQKVTP